MMTTRVKAILVAGAALVVAPALAQYKYVDPEGRTTYSDQPAPPSAGAVTQTRLNAPSSPTVTLPFGLQQATQKYPVTLYTGDHCTPCDDARTYLRNRGVPFAEKTVTSDDDIALFKQQSPDGTAPVILIGSRKTVGFAPSTVSSLLDSAGYPATSILPRDYEAPPPTPLSPTTKAPATNLAQPEPQAPSRTEPSSASAAPQSPNTPPGFRF